jgi:hypothetical protein
VGGGAPQERCPQGKGHGRCRGGRIDLLRRGGVRMDCWAQEERCKWSWKRRCDDKGWEAEEETWNSAFVEFSEKIP